MATRTKTLTTLVIATGLLLVTACDAQVQPQTHPPAAAPATPDRAAATVRNIDVAEAAKVLKEDPQVIVLDVRTPKEFEAGHIAGARNIDFNQGTFESELGKLDRTKRYLVHCAAGGRSGRSLEVFRRLGFQSVLHLPSGFNGWLKAGQPVQK